MPRAAQPVCEVLLKIKARRQNAGLSFQIMVASLTAHQAHHQGDDEQHQEYEEKNLCYGSRSACNATESKYARDYCDHKKYQSVVQHGELLFPILA
jgi:hypothetical protein